MHTIDISPVGQPPEHVTATADFQIDGRAVCMGCLGGVLKNDPVRSEYPAVQTLTEPLINALAFDVGVQQVAMSPEEGAQILKALFDVDVVSGDESSAECSESGRYYNPV
jgi:hypothetical protein